MSECRWLREKLAWFPTIDYDRCRLDLKCLNFCPYDVFVWDAETGRPVVAHPDHCALGCDICAQNCGADAVSLPGKDEFRAVLRRLRSNDRIFLVPPSIL
jgi:NAD-dependent dihydropyrimidine dehydrogenase PreA subunit